MLRYHFSGLHDENYERAPYRNHQSGAEQAKHITRYKNVNEFVYACRPSVNELQIFLFLTDCYMIILI